MVHPDPDPDRRSSKKRRGSKPEAAGSRGPDDPPSPYSADPRWIEAGKYPRNERIPSETELMEEFEIGRTTARKAVAWLRDQGLVETVPTRGPTSSDAEPCTSALRQVRPARGNAASPHLSAPSISSSDRRPYRGGNLNCYWLSTGTRANWRQLVQPKECCPACRRASCRRVQEGTAIQPLAASPGDRRGAG